MKRCWYIVLTAYLMLACNREDVPAYYIDELRTQYFPKTELKPAKLPSKENLWVFLLAGQSNMAGRALVQPIDTLPSNRVLVLNENDEFILAKEPLHYYEPDRTGLDCGLSFGKELIKHLPDSVSVLLLPTAIGGSSISQWLSGGTARNVSLFTNFRNKMEIGRAHGTIKGVLWHQGEKDALSPDDVLVYEDRLRALFINFRLAAGLETLPIIIGELGSFSANQANWNRINDQIRFYAGADSLTTLVPTSDLKDRGDQIHFNSEGQRTLGQRYAQEFIAKFK